ncbi:MAG: flagellar filament capping protein FliD, partial [Gammaproteobacteria bacterium]|nr:flagellar filament capping protein FliD [Gammaproteobacteria bacterium]
GTSTGTGTLTLQFGRWDAGSFAADGESTPLAITIAPGEDSIAGVAAKINAANAGVVATVVTDTTGQRLLLRSKGTGEASGFRVQATDDDGVNTDDAGLSRLAFDPESGAFGMAGASQAAATQYGQNAKATLNGIAITSESNTLSDTVPGLSLTVAQVTTAPVEVGVQVDKTAITKLANDFVTAYNATNSLLNDATKYDPENKQAALLQGDQTTVSLQNALRRLMGTSSTGGAYSMLSQVGIGVSAAGDGSIALDSSKFSAALNKPAYLQALFSADTGDASTSGFGRKLKSLMDGLVGTGGALDSKTTSLTTQRKNNQKDQDNFSQRLTDIEARLRKQYTALDTQMAQFNALSSYVTQQVAQWNKSSS